MAEPADRGGVLGEDRDPVAEPAPVDDLQRLVEIGGPDHREHGTEHLLLSDRHLRPDAVEDRRTQVRRPRVARRDELAAVERRPAPSETARSIHPAIRSRAAADMTGPSSEARRARGRRGAHAPPRAVAPSPSWASPTVTSTEPAMQRCPAAPNAEPRIPSTVRSITASGSTTMWFFAPPSACTRLPARPSARRRAAATGAEPTNETASMPGWSRIASTTSATTVDESHDAGRQSE